MLQVGMMVEIKPNAYGDDDGLGHCVGWITEICVYGDDVWVELRGGGEYCVTRRRIRISY
jgi:hypothetical protein